MDWIRKIRLKVFDMGMMTNQLSRFKHLFDHSLLSICKMVASRMQIGRRVFEALELLRNTKLNHSATDIQRHVRRIVAQLYYFYAMIAAVIIQCLAREITARSVVGIKCLYKRLMGESSSKPMTPSLVGRK